MRLRAVIDCAILAPLLLALASPARADPPSREQVAQWCADAEDPAHCGRLIEAQQLKRLPGLAVRNGNELRITLFPTGSTTFTDEESLFGGTSYSLWDNWSPVNAVVLYVTRDERTTFTILQRATGRRFDLPAEPVLSPDRRHVVTADFCASDCSNEVALWQVSRDGIVKQSSWKPEPAWSDADIRWKDADTLAVEYTQMGDARGRTQERKLADQVWRGAAAH